MVFSRKVGLRKTLEIEQKRVKLVDASDMAVRVHAEKAVSTEEEEWQVLMESVGRKNGRLRAVNPGENVKTRASAETDMSGASRANLWPSWEHGAFTRSN